MTLLLYLYFNIATLKARPQDIPESTFLAVITVFSYGLLSLGISTVELSFTQAVLSAVADTGLLLALGFISLWIISAPERKKQVITALAGTGVLIQLFAWPVYIWLSHAIHTNSTLLFVPRTGLILLVLWNIIIIAHILRHALSISFPITFGISVLYVFFTIRIANMLFIAAG